MKIDFSKNPTILNNYLKYLLNVCCFSEGTVEGYNRDILGFFRYIKKENNIPIEIKDFNIFLLIQIKREDIISFMVYLNLYRNNKPTTRQRKLAAIKSFFKWLTLNYPGNIAKNPAEKLPFVEKMIRLPKYLTVSEAKKIQNVFTKENCRFPERNNSIISLFLSSGIRLSELINIRLNDINFNNNSIKIIGKGNKERTVYFNNVCKQKIEKYLTIRNNNIKIIEVDQSLFLNKSNKHLSKREVEYICEKAYKLLGLENKGYSTHTLRHTAATLMYRYSGENILLVKEFLGHSSIVSTEIYTHIHSKQLKEAVEKNPLNKYIIEKKAA